MRVRYAVTFEFDTRAPLTHRGETSGGTAATCVHRATRDAQRALKPINWASMNCVLLERLDAEPKTGVALPDGPAQADRGDEDDTPAT